MRRSKIRPFTEDEELSIKVLIVLKIFLNSGVENSSNAGTAFDGWENGSGNMGKKEKKGRQFLLGFHDTP